ncbi:hypothetical protein [Mucilaginibacter pocheonensis]|uniref:Uncharacterized protein n=1 Tax=Mucilaginibacter pocheonensis TaxID=398050 RepID=A0ABU1TAH2_9SPHI|nr:hypothetical protein [Mucilaginibacter pocheonensis]MDR6942344.1 hypothetical protein [Mucilaginibacter pocheonensis]
MKKDTSMNAFDKNTSMGVFDKNTSMGAFDKNTSMGRFAANEVNAMQQNLGLSGDSTDPSTSNEASQSEDS